MGSEPTAGGRFIPTRTLARSGQPCPARHIVTDGSAAQDLPLPPFPLIGQESPFADVPKPTSVPTVFERPVERAVEPGKTTSCDPPPTRAPADTRCLIITGLSGGLEDYNQRGARDKNQQRAENHQDD